MSKYTWSVCDCRKISVMYAQYEFYLNKGLQVRFGDPEFVSKERQQSLEGKTNHQKISVMDMLQEFHLLFSYVVYKKRFQYINGRSCEYFVCKNILKIQFLEVWQRKEKQYASHKNYQKLFNPIRILLRNFTTQQSKTNK